MNKILAFAFTAAFLAISARAAGPNFSFGTTFVTKTNISLTAIASGNTTGTLNRITSGSTTNGSWNTPPAASYIRGRLYLQNTNSLGIAVYNTTGATNGASVVAVISGGGGTLLIERPILDSTEYSVGSTNSSAAGNIFGYEMWGTVE